MPPTTAPTMMATTTNATIEPTIHRSLFRPDVCDASHSLFSDFIASAIRYRLPDHGSIASTLSVIRADWFPSDHSTQPTQDTSSGSCWSKCRTLWRNPSQVVYSSQASTFAGPRIAVSCHRLRHLQYHRDEYPLGPVEDPTQMSIAYMGYQCKSLEPTGETRRDGSPSVWWSPSYGCGEKWPNDAGAGPTGVDEE